jgi:hypothetical protein
MKFSIALLISALSAFMFGLYLPWWGTALAGFVTAMLVPQSAYRSFLSGFLGVFILWGSMAWWIDFKNHHILSTRLAQLFPLGGHGLALVLLTALLGGIVAGSAACSGALLHSWIRKN